jgi:hypothetical protein
MKITSTSVCAYAALAEEELHVVGPDRLVDEPAEPRGEEDDQDQLDFFCAPSLPSVFPRPQGHELQRTAVARVQQCHKITLPRAYRRKRQLAVAAAESGQRCASICAPCPGLSSRRPDIGFAFASASARSSSYGT